MEQGSQIIDGTGFIYAIHQDHGYAHCNGGMQGAWKGVEAVRNQLMAGEIGCNSFTTAAAWMFDENGNIVPKPRSEVKCSTEEFRQKRRQWFIEQAGRLEREGQGSFAKFYHELAADV
jgi:hypothetical protein